MFSKKNDILLKITNMILIITATISLGIAIGATYNYEKVNYTLGCGGVYNGNTKDTYNTYNTSCEGIQKIEENNILRIMNISYSIFGTSIVSLILCNVIKSKN